MIIASLYSKPVNKSIAFHYGQKNNGYSAFIPNTRYLVITLVSKAAEQPLTTARSAGEIKA